MSNTKSTVLLKHHLKALKLPTMLAECEKIAQRAAADNADHLAFLLQLSELELIERDRKAAERRLKAAKFPAHKTLASFDFKSRASVNKPLVLELIQGEYLDRRENILLVGPSGTGKTHLAIALGMAACASARKVRFFRVTELITTLLEAKEERQLLRVRGQLAKLERNNSVTSSASNSPSVPTSSVIKALGSMALRVYVPNARSRIGPKSGSRSIMGFGVPHLRSVS